MSPLFLNHNFWNFPCQSRGYLTILSTPYPFLFKQNHPINYWSPILNQNPTTANQLVEVFPFSWQSSTIIIVFFFWLSHDDDDWRGAGILCMLMEFVLATPFFQVSLELFLALLLLGC